MDGTLDPWRGAALFASHPHFLTDCCITYTHTQNEMHTNTIHTQTHTHKQAHSDTHKYDMFRKHCCSNEFHPTPSAKARKAGRRRNINVRDH